jgi:aryl carrier-like protein
MSVGKTTCLPPADEPPDAASIIELIKTTQAASLMTVPLLLDEIAARTSRDAIDTLAQLDFVGTGGAALGAGVGNRLTEAGVKILNFYGTTETGHLSQTFAPKPDSYEWRFFRVRADIKFHITPLATHHAEEMFRLTIFPFGGTDGIEVEDQLIRNRDHPETDFVVVGRDDDLIVLATGEKVDPSHLESMLSNSGLVKAAVAFGVNRFEIGVIVQPNVTLLSTAQHDQFEDAVWPLIVQAGEKMDAFARVSSPDAIIVVSEETVIPRADKGSILRQEVYKLLREEIDQAYERLEQGAANVGGIEALDSNNLEQSIKGLIQKHVNLRLGPEEWTTEDNLFDLGVDSLQILKLRRALLEATRSVSDGPDLLGHITPDFVYANPSVQQMANALRGTADSPQEESAWQEVGRLVQEYSLRRDTPTWDDNAEPSSQPGDMVVLLTGSSGSLGSHCMADLARSSQVSEIVCLIRTGKGGTSFDGDYNQRAVLRSRGIDLSEKEWSKLSLLACDPTSNLFDTVAYRGFKVTRLSTPSAAIDFSCISVSGGLSEEHHASLARRVTHIVHAAWPTDFHRRLSSFRYQL